MVLLILVVLGLAQLTGPGGALSLGVAALIGLAAGVLVGWPRPSGGSGGGAPRSPNEGPAAEAAKEGPAGGGALARREAPPEKPRERFAPAPQLVALDEPSADFDAARYPGAIDEGAYSENPALGASPPNEPFRPFGPGGWGGAPSDREGWRPSTAPPSEYAEHGAHDRRRGSNRAAARGNAYELSRTAAPRAADATADDEANNDEIDGDERLVYNQLGRNDPTRPMAGVFNRTAWLDQYLREEVDQREEDPWWGRHEV